MERKVLERALTRAEEQQLLDHVGALRDALAQRDHGWMRYLRFTGLRISAFAALTVGDARQALRTKYCRALGAKGAPAYQVFHNEQAREAVRDLLRVREAMSGEADPPAAAPLVLNRRGRRLSVRSYQARMQAWVAAAGLPVAASPHWWRHTRGRRIVQNSTAREPLLIVQRQLGHCSLSSTGIYSAPDREEFEHAMEAAG